MLEKMKFLMPPEDVYEPVSHAGKLVRVCYASESYDEEKRMIEKDALVYLPYGYGASEQKRYPVLYLMHGGGGNSDELFGGLEAKTTLKTMLDACIESGYAQSMIVVAPSFMFEGNEEARTGVEAACALTHRFPMEMKWDLIAAIDEKFRTFRTREARAFGGFSMGAETTWSVFCQCLREVKYFLPMSGDYWIKEVQGGASRAKETVDCIVDSIKESGVAPEEFVLYACTGDKDIAYEAMDTMLREMAERKEWFHASPDPDSGNFHYCLKKGGIHTYVDCYEYIYNALPHLFDGVTRK